MSQKGRAGDGGRDLAKVDQRAARSTEKGHLQDPVRIGPGKSIVIDMSQLPTPTNVYDADVAWIEHRFGDVRLFFGKVSRNKEHALRSRLEIRYPPEAVVGHLWRNSRVFHDSLIQHLAKWTAGQEERASLTPQAWPAEKEHSEWANFESMAHAGSEAALDFYSLPPRGIAMFAQGKGSHALDLAPVVRVQMSSFELLHLLTELADIIEVVRGQIPEGFERKAEPVNEEER